MFIGQKVPSCLINSAPIIGLLDNGMVLHRQIRYCDLGTIEYHSRLLSTSKHIFTYWSLLMITMFSPLSDGLITNDSSFKSSCGALDCCWVKLELSRTGTFWINADRNGKFWSWRNFADFLRNGKGSCSRVHDLHKLPSQSQILCCPPNLHFHAATPLNPVGLYSQPWGMCFVQKKFEAYSSKDGCVELQAAFQAKLLAYNLRSLVSLLTRSTGH